mmetsp:Transcript_31755/g.80281  ORF Transcript_31755/g.80281 Transcript_31755/m.80281 type:complete len:216 (-) Transcript_31755:235-882(-)|eukprot:jgi/Tetstr1/435241/TSEL_024160.t1
MGVERHHSELEEANAKIAALTRERDYLDEQVSRLQGALDARGRECAQTSEQLAIAVAAKNMMLQRMEQQQQLWRDRTDEILLRAAVDLNRQARELGRKRSRNQCSCCSDRGDEEAPPQLSVPKLGATAPDDFQIPGSPGGSDLSNGSCVLGGDPMRPCVGQSLPACLEQPASSRSQLQESRCGASGGSSPTQPPRTSSGRSTTGVFSILSDTMSE